VAAQYQCLCSCDVLKMCVCMCVCVYVCVCVCVHVNLVRVLASKIICFCSCVLNIRMYTFFASTQLLQNFGPRAGGYILWARTWALYIKLFQSHWCFNPVFVLVFAVTFVYSEPVFILVAADILLYPIPVISVICAYILYLVCGYIPSQLVHNLFLINA
jgi:hypothetical protein